MDFKKISPEQLKQMMAEKQLNLVDIRDSGSYQSGHIPEAVHLDNSSVDEFVNSADPDKALVIYCYHGISSQSAAAFFCEKGFSEVYSLDGGFEGWS